MNEILKNILSDKTCSKCTNYNKELNSCWLSHRVLLTTAERSSCTKWDNSPLVVPIDKSKWKNEMVPDKVVLMEEEIDTTNQMLDTIKLLLKKKYGKRTFKADT